MKKSRLILIANIGALGGLASWVLLHSCLYLYHYLEFLPILDIFIYQGMMIGLGLGIFIYPKDALLHRNFMAFRKRAPLGVLIGLGSGFFSFALGQCFVTFYIPFLVIRLISWTLLGGFLGFFCSVTIPTSKRIIFQCISGGLGGLIGGSIFEIGHWGQVPYFDNFVGLLIFGTILPVSITLIEIFFSKSYLRVLTGKNAGEVFLLDKNIFQIGYSSRCDVILSGYLEVCDRHAKILKNNNQFQIINEQRGGQVLVNYRLVDHQTIKKGDVIKIGSAILQYCELT